MHVDIATLTRGIKIVNYKHVRKWVNVCIHTDSLKCSFSVDTASAGILLYFPFRDGIILNVHA